MRTRIALAASAVALAFALGGCYSAPPTQGTSATGSTEPTATPTFFQASRTDGGVALGAELQRTKEGVLGGKLWVMSTTGKEDLSGGNPVISLLAVDAKGKRTVVQNVKADATAALGSVQATFARALPPGTAQLVLTTTLSAATTAPADVRPPVVTVRLADVPQVDKLTLVGP